MEQAEAERQEHSAPAVGEEAEVADAHEAAWQKVEQEAAQKLFGRQGHEPFLVAVSRVSPAEGDVSVGESNQPVVGDGDAVGIYAEITQRVLRPTEGPFGVDDPFMAEQKSAPSGEGARFSKRQEVAVELKCACMKRGLDHMYG